MKTKSRKAKGRRLQMKTVYDFYSQAGRHGRLEPVVIMKQNSREPLVVIGFDYFFELIK